MPYVIKFTSNHSTSNLPGKVQFLIDDYRVNGPVNPADPTPAQNNDGSITGNTVSTSLLIQGRGMPNWGDKLEENLLYLLENFYDETPPINPTKGQLWFDAQTNRLASFDGTDWSLIDAVYASATAPTDRTGVLNPLGNSVDDITIKAGQLWFDSSVNILKVYNGSTWVSVADDYVLKSGDIMTGFLNLEDGFSNPKLPTSAQHAANKLYVDNHINDADLHLTSHQNSLLDDIESMYNTLTAMELGALDDFNTAGGSVQTQIDSKLSLDGTLSMTGNLDIGNNKIINLGLATTGTDALSQNAGDARYLQLTGGTLSGGLNLGSNIISNVGNAAAGTDALNRDSGDARYLIISTGGTVSGNIVMSGAGVQIQNPNAPVTANDLTNKSYVDGIVGGTPTASSVTFTPAGGVSSANVQNAIEEVDTEKVSLAGDTMDLNADLTFNGGEVLGLPATPSATGAASKEYVDSTAAAASTITRTLQNSPGRIPTDPETVPSYIVDSNKLWIFVNGQKFYEGYGYNESGAPGTPSTTIIWQETITAGAVIEYLVFS